MATDIGHIMGLKTFAAFTFVMLCYFTFVEESWFCSYKCSYFVILVLGWKCSYGLKTRYNILLCLFHENIAPSEGNLDAIRGGLVNLLAYSHEVSVAGQEVEVEPVDIMDFIYKETYDVVITKKKNPVYVPYIMVLLKAQQTRHPLLTTNLTTHKFVKPQRKASLGIFEENFASSDDEEGGDDNEEIEEVAPSHA
jgi:hypothetical protein